MRFLLLLIPFLLTAQLYFERTIGFINLRLEKGFNLVSNQLDDGNNNYVVNLFDNKIDNETIFYKYNGENYDILIFEFDEWIGATNMTLSAGEGVFLLAPDKKTVTLTGDVIEGQVDLELSSGFSIFSSTAPIKTDLSDENLNWPLENGDIFYKWNKYEQQYEIIIYDIEWMPQSLVLKNGEAAWVNKMSSQKWSREFKIDY